MTDEDRKNFSELYADKAYLNWLSEAQRHSIDELYEFISRTTGHLQAKKREPEDSLETVAR